MTRILPVALLLACGTTEEPILDGILVWEAADDRFTADPRPQRGELFTVVAADMEGDGDPDVILQRHHQERTEVFENRGGQLVQVNRRSADESGLYDNPGIPDLFDFDGEMASVIAQSGQPGLYIWHDEDREGVWNLEVVGPAMELQVRVNRPVSAVEGLEEAAVEVVSQFSFAATVPDDTAFTVANPLVATQLVVDVLSAQPVTIYQGRHLVPETSGRVELWKNDPHGIAWVDQLGGAELELFITRGGLTGHLAPPQDPKLDQWFTWSGGATLWSVVPGFPRDYCRGRQVTWMDVDLDGVDELFVACTATPNKLLDRDETGEFVDIAPAWGLDSEESESFAWLDVDGDGSLDLVQNQAQALEVLLHRGDHFEQRSGDEFGLTLPAPVLPPTIGVFTPFTLQAIDHDRDGDLDLWASQFGDHAQLAVLRNDGGVFVDATSALGLEDQVDVTSVLPVDVDRDGWLDLYGVDAASVRLYRNRRGHFAVTRLEAEARLKDAAAADIDGDGNTDLVGLGPTGQRRVVFDRHLQGGRPVSVQVDGPMGSLVRGHYHDGSVQLYVHGGNTSRYSQVAAPIVFGSGAGDNELVGVSLQRPGEGEGTAVPVGAKRSIELR